MERITQITLKHLKNWHKGMVVGELNLDTGEVQKIDARYPEDVFIVKERCVYKWGMNMKTVKKKFDRLIKRASYLNNSH